MNSILAQSRVMKPLFEVQDITMQEAQRILDSVYLAVVVSDDQAKTRAGQAAVLTALNTGYKCFGRVILVVGQDERLLQSFPLGNSLIAAAKRLGAQVTSETPSDATHIIDVGSKTAGSNFRIMCWWDGWQSGTFPWWSECVIGDSSNPLAGVFSGALAVREVFASIRLQSRAGKRESHISLWTPWLTANPQPGPKRFYSPLNLWAIGLGHLGQGYMWSLGFIPAQGNLLVLQDHDKAKIENVATGLITSPSQVGSRKTRVAAEWMKGWETQFIERDFGTDFARKVNEPTIVLTGLHDLSSRLAVASARFPYMVDAGVGHGPEDFERAQIRILASGDNHTWSTNGHEAPNIDEMLTRKKAYREYVREFGDRCGAIEIAGSGAAVPFVGAAVGALTVAHLIRLVGMKDTPKLLQLELGCLAESTVGEFNPPTETNLGFVDVNLT